MIDVQGRYRPGAWYVLFGPTTVVMVDDEVALSRIQRLWGTVSAYGGVDEIVGELTTGGLGGLPVFGVVMTEPAGLRVVVRPGVALLADRGDGQQIRVETTTATTWTEEVVQLPARARLVRTDPPAAARARAADPLPIAAGVVRADEVEWAPSGGPGALVTGAIPIQDLMATVRDRPAVPSDARPRRPRPVRAEPVPAEPVPAEPVPAEPVPAEPVRAEPVPAEPVPAEPAPVDAPAGPSVETLEPVWAVEGLMVSDVPLSRSGTGPAAAGVIDGLIDGLIDGVPLFPADLPGASDGTAPAVASITVSRSDLPPIPGGGGAGDASGNPEVMGAGVVPMVHAILCSDGHPNPVQVTRCRTCDEPLGYTQVHVVARPPLGLLRFTTGQEVVLDRNVLVGRAPRTDAVTGSDLPRPVRIDGHGLDISRNHLEVRLEGWHVLVIDLASRNGTLVTLPGRPAQLLDARVPCLITVGTVVTLADEVGFSYEVPA